MSLCKHGNDDVSCHECDLEIPCPTEGCYAAAGSECPGVKGVHFGRRLKRLLMQRRPDLLEEPS